MKKEFGMITVFDLGDKKGLSTLGKLLKEDFKQVNLPKKRHIIRPKNKETVKRERLKK